MAYDIPYIEYESGEKSRPVVQGIWKSADTGLTLGKINLH